jgi:AcrR family transcriptional regulator
MAVETSTDRSRGSGSFDLRERKRTRTRLMIQTEALRLFNEKSYAETTVEEIADAAAISPSTFFRYFPAKEDVVMWDEYDPLAHDLLESRPDDEPLAETFRAGIRESLGGLYRRDPERLLSRVRLMATVPELRSRFLDEQTHGIEQLAPRARKRGAGVDEVRPRVIGSALLAAVGVALDLWQKDDGRGDLLALVDRAIDSLADGMSDLQSRAREGTEPAKRRRARR